MQSPGSAVRRRDFLFGLAAATASSPLLQAKTDQARPNFVLCMADDQGWGDVAYNGNPVLKTPVLDEMSRTGLRFDRFYAAAPVCSPTRGSVLTGRHPNRFGCFSWGYPLRPREVTIAEALRSAGYATGHFGKWHLGEVRADSPVSPGASGFDEWLSAANFYDNNALMSDKGTIIQTKGEGSQVAVDAAIRFIRDASRRKQPFLAVVWFGSPHAPHEALPEDREPYKDQPENMQHFYGEITAMDRAIGNLRKELRALKLAGNTLLWYNSDNGAIKEGSTGGLRGRKADLEEGGIRVPAIIEWPARIPKPRATEIPCGTVDIYPTLVELAGAKVQRQVLPLDGVSLVPMIDGRMDRREKPLGFWVYPEPGIRTASEPLLRELLEEQEGKRPKRAAQPDPGRNIRQFPLDARPGPSAWIDGDYKLHRKPGEGQTRYLLYNIRQDQTESHDLATTEPERVSRMKAALEAWQASVARSLNGLDY
ncbi:MAG: sulfatase-like hydrolase/transferase [Bryobacterales bacterium]|nr:sulfatase-like hydrolase/transferase [Bryobacterales bacterium]